METILSSRLAIKDGSLPGETAGEAMSKYFPFPQKIITDDGSFRWNRMDGG